MDVRNLIPSLNGLMTPFCMQDKYTSVFRDELVGFPGEVHLEVDPSVDPVVESPRRIPHAMKDKVKNEVDKLVEHAKDT